jgi:hypothetical protein
MPQTQLSIGKGDGHVDAESRGSFEFGAHKSGLHYTYSDAVIQVIMTR